MNAKGKLKIREALYAVLPISVIILMISFTVAPLSSDVMSLFIMGTILLMVGMGLFTLGAEISMSLIGERVGASIAKQKNILLVIIVLFILGSIITIAEPDLKVLANQISSIPSEITVLAVGIGVGVFLAIAFLRIIFRIDISYLLVIFYGIIFLLINFVPSEFWAIAFDSGGVTTGPMTVPLIIALGIGATSIRENKDSNNDSFGLVALCSIGPILAMLILGMLYKITDIAYPTYLINSFNDSKEMGMIFISSFSQYISEVAIVLLPILIFFMAYQTFILHLPKREIKKILVGVVYIFVGLVLFLTGANIGFLPAGYIIGTKIAALEFNWIIIPIGMIIGYFIVIAEPAVNILVKQISDITDGAIPERAMKFNLSISMAIALCFAMIRLLIKIPIMYFLIPGYIIAVILSFFAPKTFTSIAFDSGGVASGPITTTFLIPFSIGICKTFGGDILTDAFGIVAFVAMMPLITIQITGIIYKMKQNKLNEQKTTLSEDEIIEIDWEWEQCLN